MYIAVAVIAFGLLIAIHELGHFTAAKLLGVRVNEFAIGMGPRLLKRQGKETVYSLRAFPFGGFCAMEGEDGDSDDSRSFSLQAGWRRVVILAAGSFANFVAGFIIVLVLSARMTGFAGTTITELADGFPNAGEQGLMEGDSIVSINGFRLYYADDFSTYMELESEGEVELVIRRGGEKIKYTAFPLVRREYETGGETRLRFGITFNVLEDTPVETVKYAGYTALNFVRLVRIQLAKLVSGEAGVRDLSGPVAIVDVMNTVGKAAATTTAAFANIAYITAYIAVNLAVMNLLPLPALDGGRILFILINGISVKLIRRQLNPKYEGYIHMTGFALLMALMVFILFSDIIKLSHG